MDEPKNWDAVIGRSLAYLCLRSASSDTKWNVQQSAQFLERLGLSRADTADLLGTTAASISELHRQAKKKGGARGKQKKK